MCGLVPAGLPQLCSEFLVPSYEEVVKDILSLIRINDDYFLSKGLGMVIPREQWSFFEWVFTSEFEVQLELLDVLDEALDASLANIQQGLRTAVGSVEDEEEYAELYALLGGEESRGEEFKTILFNSLFAASFALFEHKLSAVCRQVQKAAGSPFSADDIRGRNRMDSIKRYLEAFGIEVPLEDSEWQELSRYQEVRNKIMHAGAALPESGDLARYARNREIASSWTGRELELNRSFCDEAIRNLEQFSLKVHRAVQSWRNRTVEDSS